MQVVRLETDCPARLGIYRTNAVEAMYHNGDFHPRVGPIGEAGNTSLYKKFDCKIKWDENTQRYVNYTPYSADCKEYFFGFRNIKQMDDWLGPTGREKIRKANTAPSSDEGERCGPVIIAHYEVDDKYVVTGDWQIAFKRDCAKLVHKEAP